MELRQIIFMQMTIAICFSLDIYNQHEFRHLLQSDDDSITTTEQYEMDCCERTTGLKYTSIDCYDHNTPTIVDEVERYLTEATNNCNNRTNCGYTTNENDNLCLIAWALYQQYYHQCPQIIETNNNNNNDDNIDSTESIDYSNAPKLINPLYYEIYDNNKECMKCYDVDYSDNGHDDSCHNLCELSLENKCGLCELVYCNGDINTQNGAVTGFYGVGALQIWERALLLASVAILGCVCCWGICYIACNDRSGNMMNRMFANNPNNQPQFQVVSSEDL